MAEAQKAPDTKEPEDTAPAHPSDEAYKAWLQETHQTDSRLLRNAFVAGHDAHKPADSPAEVPPDLNR